MTAQLQLGISLETLFPLVAELAKELANGLFLQTSQVRIVGANAEDQDQGKTDVSAQFVPLDTAFDNTTADLLATRIWTHQVTLNETLFGNYSVIFVQYPGIYNVTKEENGLDMVLNKHTISKHKLSLIDFKRLCQIPPCSRSKGLKIPLDTCL